MEESDVVRYIRGVIGPGAGADVGPSPGDGAECHELVKVVNAESMTADDFWRHCRIRHPELWYERRIAILRDEHDTSHRLTQFALGHFHIDLDDAE